MQADGRTDRNDGNDEANSHFSQFSNAPKMNYFLNIDFNWISVRTVVCIMAIGVPGNFSVTINHTGTAKQRRQNKWQLYVSKMYMNGTNHQPMFISTNTLYKLTTLSSGCGLFLLSAWPALLSRSVHTHASIADHCQLMMLNLFRRVR
jgi:hypothetical protein